MLPKSGMAASTGKPSSFCNSSLSSCFPARLRPEYGMWQEWVARRFPFLVFDPVQNAGQRGLPFAQPVISFRCLNSGVVISRA